LPPYSAIEYECQTENAPNTADPMKREILDAVKRWYQYDWLAIENKLRTSIVEGISVFLSLFDDNPLVKRTFCPPKECYHPKLGAVVSGECRVARGQGKSFPGLSS